MRQARFFVLASLLLLVTACSPSAEKAPAPANPVPVDLWIMSQCPFGTHAERLMGKVVDALGPGVRLRILYIVDKTPEGNLQSLHGEEEVHRDMVEACVGELFPDDQLNFINAWNDAPDQEYPAVASFLKLDEAKIRQCAEGGRGRELLEATLPEREKLGVDSSPTMLVEGTEYKGHRSSLSIAEAICALRKGDADFGPICDKMSPALTYADSNPTQGSCAKPAQGEETPGAVFAGPVEDTPVRVTVIYSKDDPEPIVGEFTKGIRRPFPNAAVEELPYPGEDAEKAIARHGIRWLPAILFGNGFDRTKAFMKAKGAFRETAGLYLANPILFGAVRNIARAETPDTLDIYFDPYEPASRGVVETVARLVAEKTAAGTKAAVNLAPIVRVDEKSQPVPKNGEAQLQECVRQTVLAARFPDKLGAYLAARIYEIEKADWRPAAQKAGIDPAELEALAGDGAFMQKLMENSLAFADFQVEANLAFVRDNQRLVPVMNKEQFEGLLASLP
jgi:hypothetical protein